MSRMTKFLKQDCEIQPYKVDSRGQQVLNEFGELQYQNPRKIKCRREDLFKEVQTANGSIVVSSARYFVDETQVVKAEYLIDGRAVISVASYINQFGRVEGYEVYV